VYQENLYTNLYTGKAYQEVNCNWLIWSPMLILQFFS